MTEKIKLYLVYGISLAFVALNVFLDIDKASVPVWGFLAMIVVLDLYHKDRLEES